MSELLLDARYRVLQAGPLSLLFDSQTGGLSNISVDNICVWRELVMLVRDHSWKTVHGRLVHLQLEQDQESIKIDFRCLHEIAPVRFS